MPTKREVLEHYIKQAATLKDVTRAIGNWLASVGTTAAPLAERGLSGIGAKQTAGRLGRAAERQTAGLAAGSPYNEFLMRGSKGVGLIPTNLEDIQRSVGRVSAFNRFRDKERRMMRNLGAGTLGAGGLGLYGGYRGIRSLIGGEEEKPVARKKPAKEEESVEKTSSEKQAGPLLDKVKALLLRLGHASAGPVEAGMGLVGVKPSTTGLVGTGRERARVGQMPGRLKGTPEKALEGRLTGLGGAVAGAGALGAGGAGYAGYKALSGGKGEEKQTAKAPEKKEAPKEKKEPEEKEAQLGTPFTDGLLQFCLERKLDGEQVADLLEKGAQAGGWIGEECQGLLDRMVK
jgi:hypothetical protein